jgi:hypothetical protein
MLKPVPGDKPLEADKVLRDFFEYRFATIDQRLEKLTDSFDKLSAAIITRAAFDELSRDVDDAEKRLRYLESQLHTARLVIAGLLIVVGPLAIAKLQELFR